MAMLDVTDNKIGQRSERAGGNSPSSTNLGKLAITHVTSHDISAVEAKWRTLEKQGILSPGQNYDFILSWINTFSIPEADQFFSVISLDGAPIILMALHRQTMFGAKVLTPFPGSHAGCTPPLIDAERMAALSDAQRKAVWQEAISSFSGIDALYFPSVPAGESNASDNYAALGQSTPADILYRTVFDNWEQCNAEQRSRSRRKHDKQQGARLKALGEVSFEAIDASSDAADAVLKRMFEQRAKRFAEQNITDPFASDLQRKFYADVAKGTGELKGLLHVLRLNGEDVAVRYNLVHGGQIFCLISSMSDDPEIQGGSPGKQCLLRVMETVFDDGYSAFDMGAGFTDEKRHWCNIQIPLKHYYVPITLRGRVFAALHKGVKTIRYNAKHNPKILSAFKTARGMLSSSKPRKPAKN